MNSVKIDNIRLSDEDSSVIILNQAKLPHTEEYLRLTEADEFYNAIKNLQVRGAPAIGIFAGFALYILAKRFNYSDKKIFFEKLSSVKQYLNSSRPTAVNLSWALNRVESAAVAVKDKEIPLILDNMRRESIAIQEDDIKVCMAISEYGLELVKDGYGILTHCNAGPLATSAYGTGLGTLFLGNERGMKFHVYSDETRPLLQGARLTSYELSKAGIDVTLICDNMAGLVMKQGRIDACFVGCDRVAANGDTANKIGTSSVAVLAKYYGIPFYVFCPTSTIDLNCRTGEEIVIEERNSEEIKNMFYSVPMAPDNVKCYNPAFDVTDNSLITSIITEKGICRPPYTDSFTKLFSKENL